MDKNILKLIKAELKDDMKQRGFKTEGQWYMRLANSEVFQSIYFQGSMSGSEFCVNFSLIPSFSGNTISKAHNFSARLGWVAYGYDRWWDYSDDSVKAVTSLIRKVLFPIFDACTTYRGLFEAVKPILMNYVWQESNQHNPAVTICNRFRDTTWARILISLNEYEYCKGMLNNRIDHLSGIIEKERIHYEEAKSKTSDPKEIRSIDLEMNARKKSFSKRIDEYKPYLAMVESGNLSDFIEETKENERKSVEALSKYIVNVDDVKLVSGESWEEILNRSD